MKFVIFSLAFLLCTSNLHAQCNEKEAKERMKVLHEHGGTLHHQMSQSGGPSNPNYFDYADAFSAYHKELKIAVSHFDKSEWEQLCEQSAKMSEKFNIALGDNQPQS